MFTVIQFFFQSPVLVKNTGLRTLYTKDNLFIRNNLYKCGIIYGLFMLSIADVSLIFVCLQMSNPTLHNVL